MKKLAKQRSQYQHDYFQNKKKDSDWYEHHKRQGRVWNKMNPEYKAKYMRAWRKENKDNP